jgi:hypothetical protein
MSPVVGSYYRDIRVFRTYVPHTATEDIFNTFRPEVEREQELFFCG